MKITLTMTMNSRMEPIEGPPIFLRTLLPCLVTLALEFSEVAIHISKKWPL